MRFNPLARQLLDGEGYGDAGRAPPGLKVVNGAAALQPDGVSKRVEREAEFFAERADVHTSSFAQSEHSGKPRVRTIRDDTPSLRSHNASMARAPKDPAHYDELRDVSGWYLSAWRSFRNLTLQDLAAEMDTSRGQVSDLENGATNSRGIQTRYNRDWLEKACKALDVAAGDLIDTNPYSSQPRFRSTGADILAAWAEIPEESRAQALKVLESFKRTGTEG